jgi:hypothetical protein
VYFLGTGGDGIVPCFTVWNCGFENAAGDSRPLILLILPYFSFDFFDS